MENHNILKILAIIIVAVMAFSMLAAAFLYVNNGTSSSSSTKPADTLPTASVTPFTYNVSFEGSALKELSTIKVAAYTSQTDKTLIDSAVLKASGVLNVASQFKKTATDANDWLYIADVSLKKNTDSVAAANSIFDVNYFDQSQRSGFSAIKYITVSVPSSVILHNTDLNIDRNFSFSSTTLSAYASLTTSAGDDLIISGTTTIAGSSVTAISLYEELNKTKQPVIDTNQLVVDNNSSPNNTTAAKTDGNVTVSDSNTPSGLK